MWLPTSTSLPAWYHLSHHGSLILLMATRKQLSSAWLPLSTARCVPSSIPPCTSSRRGRKQIFTALLGTCAEWVLKEESNCKSEPSLIALASPTLFLLSLSLWLAKTALQSLCRKPRDGHRQHSLCACIKSDLLCTCLCDEHARFWQAKTEKKITAGLVFH